MTPHSQDEPIAAPFLNSQDAPCPRDKTTVATSPDKATPTAMPSRASSAPMTSRSKGPGLSDAGCFIGREGPRLP